MHVAKAPGHLRREARQVALLGEAVFQLKAHRAMQSVTDRGHKADVEPELAPLHAEHWKDGRKPTTIQGLGVAAEAPHHRTCFEGSQPIGHGIEADVVRGGTVAVVKHASSDRVGVCERQLNTKAGIDVVEVFIALQVVGVEAWIDPGIAHIQVECVCRCIGTQGHRQHAQCTQVAKHHNWLKTAAAASTVAEMSAALWAALTKPASYSAGAMYTPRSSKPWNSLLKRGLSLVITLA